ncbi:MAG: hypothetical protein ACP5IX_01470 [Patescibacteria group bacterium]
MSRGEDLDRILPAAQKIDFEKVSFKEVKEKYQKLNLKTKYYFTKYYFPEIHLASGILPKHIKEKI